MKLFAIAVEVTVAQGSLANVVWQSLCDGRGDCAVPKPGIVSWRRGRRNGEQGEVRAVEEPNPIGPIRINKPASFERDRFDRVVSRPPIDHEDVVCDVQVARRDRVVAFTADESIGDRRGLDGEDRKAQGEKSWNHG